MRRRTEAGRAWFRLLTRQWARTQAGGSALVIATYGYNADGDLVSVQYSDDTPAVTFTTDRLGRPLSVTDGSGTRTYDYGSDGLRL